MSPMVLEGTTLGQRHQHYNNLLKQAIADNSQPAEIDYNKTDLENLINIDIANNNKDVQYILDVFRGDDMLYVLRAIKGSSWLINEEQYAHIIEPRYLHTEFFPQMMPKASSKLLLYIRLTLKNESRVDQFFQYLKKSNLKAALKWLPRCSLGVIETSVDTHANDITPDIFKRLCERSSNVLEIFAKASDGDKTDQWKAAMYLLRQNPEKYLDALIKYEDYDCYPTFGKKQTEIVMKKCPHRFIDEFEKFKNCIDIDTFAKHLNKEDIESVILKYFDNKAVKSFSGQEKICIFLKHMPVKGNYELIQHFIIKSQATEICHKENLNAYCWYKYVLILILALY